MNNSNLATYTIAPGDTLYSIARRFNTTIDTIMDANQYLDPRKLMVGDKITVFKRQDGLDSKGISQNALGLMEAMRTLVDDHIVWDRQYVVSVGDNLRDMEVVNQKLIANASAIGNLFGKYYGVDNASRITNLLKQHVLLISELVKSSRRGDTVGASNYDRELRSNGDEIAFLLSSLNPYYAEDSIRNMLYQHINMIRNIIANRFARNYTAEAEAFDKARDQSVVIADYLTNGIIEQFPNRFA
jgi:murein DD-endopeptidase MepM/ murein hydrolase activator NlpD